MHLWVFDFDGTLSTMVPDRDAAKQGRSLMKQQEKVKMHMPEVRDALLRLLSSKSPEELATTEGKDKLASEVQGSVNEILGVKKAAKGVKKVLFNAFIIQ